MKEKKNEYLTFLKKVKKVSKNTYSAYEKDLNDYILYLNDKKISLSKIKKNTIYVYENYLASTGKSTASIARALASGGKYLKGCSFVDIYTGSPIPEGHKSVTFALTLRADDETLTAEHAEETMKNILAALESVHGAVIR